ncbi:TRAP transporter substrate-binding protein DctP [Roseiarcaceae bacterium H3SJ34-1]|uniref:TRAP transporter substrate-binding protein n=1 Tax=Terripilifer ovatus TaxID=3032367 RepID=UPI003AB95510|nr:TRAP transporter substrate-binding protein DctP [Roseiarcaceae bacterium H3SJ34-1]
MRIRSLGLLMTVLFAAGAAQAQPVKLRFASSIPDGETATVVFKPFVEAVNKEANGAIEIELFQNGVLGRNPLQQAQMIIDGVADLGWVILPQSRGRFRETEVLELPGVFRDLEEATHVSNQLLKKGLLQGFDEYYVVGLVGTGPTSIHSRGQITSVDSIKGRKIRAGGALESSAIRALGGAPVALTFPEIIEAVGRGNVDGITALPSTLFDFGFVSVVNTHYFTRLGNLPMAILMNRQKFNELPKAGQDAIRKYSGDWIAQKYNEGIGRYYQSLFTQLQNDPKRRVITPSEAESAQAQALFRPVIDEWASKDLRNKQLLNSLQDEIAANRRP